MRPGAALLAAVTVLATLLVPGTPAPAAGRLASAAATPAAANATTPLTNLAHLDWLRDSVSPPAQPQHTTYRLDREPAVGVLWTYADRNPDGTYRRLGGGRYDPGSNRYGQGAFNAN